MGSEFGLPASVVAAVRLVLAERPEIEKAVIYGSRANGNYKNGSDIDLTLIGPEVDDEVLSKVSGMLQDLPIPYSVDLSRLEAIDNPRLREHIERVGKIFFERKGR